jgi:hypothetical protein
MAFTTLPSDANSQPSTNDPYRLEEGPRKPEPKRDLNNFSFTNVKDEWHSGSKGRVLKYYGMYIGVGVLVAVIIGVIIWAIRKHT